MITLYGVPRSRAMRVGRIVTGSFVAGLAVVLAAPPRVAWGAPCVRACRDEIAACRSADCKGLTRKAAKRCKRSCATTIVQDCYRDLTVCGATTARPPKPGSGGGPPAGGW
jgi:hypothetical protein